MTKKETKSIRKLQRERARGVSEFGRQMLALFDVLDMCDQNAIVSLVERLVPSASMREETIKDLAAAAGRAGSRQLARRIHGMLDVELSHSVARYSAEARELAKRTKDAYSYKRYASWYACADALLKRGYTVPAAAVILRSKITRWAADAAHARDGRATSKDLLRYIDAHDKDIRFVLDEEGLAS